MWDMALRPSIQLTSDCYLKHAIDSRDSVRPGRLSIDCKDDRMIMMSTRPKDPFPEYVMGGLVRVLQTGNDASFLYSSVLLHRQNSNVVRFACSER